MWKVFPVYAFGCFLSLLSCGAQGPVLTEFMASNTRTLADESGRFPDWIEIHNASETRLDLKGWYLTDDPQNLQKWVFPTTQIEPFAYGVVFAKGSDEFGENSPAKSLRVPFKLRRKGEYIALVQPDGVTVVSAFGSANQNYPEQRSDVSYGRFQSSGSVPWVDESFFYFTDPTPGMPNRNDGILGFVNDVAFSVGRGFFEDPVEVELASDTLDAVIFYTKDGSAPTPETGRAYSRSISISTTTVLRAMAVKPGYLSSPSRSQTYLFLLDVIHQPVRPSGYPNTWHTQNADYEMDPDVVESAQYRNQIIDSLRTHPTISIAIAVDDLFDQTTGIYSNSQAKGDFWERPISVEFFDFPHGEELQVNAALRMQGNASRSFNRAKHNMRIAFRRAHGPGRLRFKLYEDSEVDRFDNVILRGQNGDSWIHPNANQRRRAQYTRDQWHRDIQVAMGHKTINQGHVHLYINGLYWGFYHLFDRAESEFMAENFGGSEEEYDVVQDFNKQPGLVEAIDGDLQAWEAMMAVAAGDLRSVTLLEDLSQFLDLENFVDYMILNFYSGNTDWDNGNWRAGRRRLEGEGFKFFAWDSERSVGDSARNSLAINTDITERNVSNRATGLHQRLTGNTEYRLFFADRVQKHLFDDGILTPARASASWMSRVDEIRLALVAEAARWGDAHRANDPYTPEDEWIVEVNRLIDSYFPARTAIVLNQFRQRRWLPEVMAPNLSLKGGEIESGTVITASTSSGKIFFTLDGTDPRLPGGSIRPGSETENRITIIRSAQVRARVRTGEQWSPLVSADYIVIPSDELKVVGTRGSGNPHGVLVYFSRPVAEEIALDTQRYHFEEQDIEIQMVTLMDSQTILLTVSAIEPRRLRLGVEGIKDDRIAGLLLDPVVVDVDLGNNLNGFRPLTMAGVPRDLKVTEFGEARFTTRVTGSATGLVTYQWYVDEEPVSGVDDDELILSDVTRELDGAAIRVVATNRNGTYLPVESPEATLQVVPDFQPPQVEGVTARAAINIVELVFDESLDALSALDISRYSIDGLDLLGLEYQERKRRVLLRTDNLVAGKYYRLQFSGIGDRANPPNLQSGEVFFQTERASYQQRVLLDQPVRYWTFSETAGSVISSSALGLDPENLGTATTVNAATLDVAGLIPNEAQGSGIRFNRSLSQKVAVNNGVDLNINRGPWTNKTIELWFRANTLPRELADGTREAAILYEQGGGTRALSMYLYGTQREANPRAAVLIWYAFNGSAGDGPGAAWGPAFGNTVFTRTTIRKGVTYHVVGVMDGVETDQLNGSLKLYLNGELVDTDVGVGQIYNHSGAIEIGFGNLRIHDNRNGNMEYFDGIMDDLSLYNTSLTGNQVLEHYRTATRFSSGEDPPQITLQRNPGELLIEYTGVLQSSSRVQGPWIDVSIQSPQRVNIDTPPEFSTDAFWRARK